MSPAAAIGSTQNYTFNFGDSAGFQNLGVVDVLINGNYLDGRSACYAALIVSTNQLVLVDDAGDSGGPYAGAMIIGAAPTTGTIQNSQCTINGAGSTVRGSGNNLTLTLAVTFKPAFTGDKIFFVAAGDVAGSNTGWQDIGVLRIPAASQSPAVVALGTNAASGLSQTFTVQYRGADASRIGPTQLLINGDLNGIRACFVAYDAADKVFVLVDDAGDTSGPWAGTVSLGSTGTASNSQCTLNGTGSTAVINGQTLTLGLNVAFKPSFTGPKIAYVAAQAPDGNTGWHAMAALRPVPPVGPPADLLISDFSPKSAPIGSSVTISGANFTGVGGSAPKVFVSQQQNTFLPATVTASSATSITFVVPAGAVSGPITVIRDLSSASSSASLTVSAASTGAISLSVSPTTVPLGIPTLVTTTASVAGGTPDPGSVMLQRLDSAGRVLALVGTLHDDGLNGDLKANDGIFTLQSTFNESATGAISLRVGATSSSAVNHVFSTVQTLNVTGTAAPAVTFTAPGNLSYLNTPTTTVTGTVSDPAATVVINSIAAPLANGRFAAQIPLAEGPNVLTATATSTSGSVGTASITVTLDTTPPHVTITSPPDQFVTTDSSISVAGVINDIVVGTVNAQQATVTVNGTAAQVANRTFLLNSVPLLLGANVIKAVGVDRVGNAATTQITVTRQALAPGQIKLISGNNQTGAIGSVVTAPLVVSLTETNGGPAVNKPVIFNVTGNDGVLAPTGITGAPAASLVTNTDSNGQAQALWTLGKRAGAGGNSVQAYAVGYNGTALFTATGNQGAAGMIVVDSGSNQTGAVNQPLPKPFIAVVIDRGNNRLANVPVTFTVQSGGGTINGQPTYTVNTDSDGRVAATLTLGLQEGTANDVVTADFASDTLARVSFRASGRNPGNPAQTIISGVVLDNSSQPVPGVTIRAALLDAATASLTSVQNAPTVQTDAKGQFAINGAPVGNVKVFVDGSTATIPGTYPTLEYDLVTIAGQVNTVNQPVYLLPLKTNNQLCVTDTMGGGTLTIPEAPGFSLTFAPGQVTFPGGSKTGCVSVTSVHPDKIPMQPGFGQQPRFIVTIQPSGALFDPPAPIAIPNVDGLAPRAVTEMYSFDHDINSFIAIGTGVVSDDGMVIRSSTGVGVLKAGWHCGGDPNANGTAADCGACKICAFDVCIGDDSRVPAGAAPACNKLGCKNGTPTTIPLSDSSTCCGGNVFDPSAQGCYDPTCRPLGQVFDKSQSCVADDIRDLSCPVLVPKNVDGNQPLSGTALCSDRTQNEKRHMFDGCSVPIALSALVAALAPFYDFTGDVNEPMEGVRFSDVPQSVSATNPTKACDVHDLCYQTCSKDSNAQQICDAKLKNLAIQACYQRYPNFPPDPYIPRTRTDGDPRLLLGECLDIAATYYTVLSAAGSLAFQQRQSQFCQCCR